MSMTNAQGLLTGGTLTPAYGRDYKSAKAAKADLLSGQKDFVLNTPMGCGNVSLSDLAPGSTFQIRYNSLRSVAVVKIPK